MIGLDANLLLYAYAEAAPEHAAAKIFLSSLADSRISALESLAA